MKINARVLGWKDKCCGCYREIKSTEKVYMISEIGGVNGSIHFCENCIVEISNAKEMKMEIEKGCESCVYNDILEGECTKGIADKLQTRDCDTSGCTCYELDKFCLF